MTATTRPRLHRSRSSVPLARLDLLTFRVHVPAPSAASQPAIQAWSSPSAAPSPVST